MLLEPLIFLIRKFARVYCDVPFKGIIFFCISKQDLFQTMRSKEKLIVHGYWSILLSQILFQDIALITLHCKLANEFDHNRLNVLLIHAICFLDDKNWEQSQQIDPRALIYVIPHT